MGIGEHLETWDGWQAAVQALVWQAELGASDPVMDQPLNRYDLVTEVPRKAEVPAPALAPDRVSGRISDSVSDAAAKRPAGADAVAIATGLADGATSLEALRAAMAGFDHCDLKLGARNLVFADGHPAARVLVLGEAPGRDEDREGRPFVGPAGQLLDQMFAAIGLGRANPVPAFAIYITNVLPWRPPENRDPSPAEIAMFRPFVLRHIALVNPDVIVVMGNTPLSCLFDEKGITRARGTWREILGKPVLPMTHPAYLLRTPEAKREAWADLLAIKHRLGTA
jgi:uracil-DNA glycosylase